MKIGDAIDFFSYSRSPLPNKYLFNFFPGRGANEGNIRSIEEVFSEEMENQKRLERFGGPR